MQFAGNDRYGVKKGAGVFDSHIQNRRDIFALITNIQRLPIVAVAFADIAQDINIRQKVHFHFD